MSEERAALAWIQRAAVGAEARGRSGAGKCSGMTRGTAAEWSVQR
jgi:hypothetical protein